MSQIHRDDESMQEMIFADLQPEMRELFIQIQNIELGCTLIHFLDSRVNAMMTVDDIAYHLVEPSTVVEKTIGAVKDLGLLRRLEAVGLVFFGLTAEPERRQLVHTLCLWQDQWHERLERIGQIIDGEVPPLQAIFADLCQSEKT